MEDIACDIAVLGSGPAGAACALALRQRIPHLEVAVFESSDYTRPRAGEVLPPHALSLLRQLQVPLEPLAATTSPSQGIASAWGSHLLRERHHIFSGHGTGLHLDRNVFDRHLATCAASAGASVHINSPFHSATRHPFGWRLDFSNKISCKSRFVIDATGRRAAFARSQGASLHHLDALTAYTRTFADAAPAEHQTRIESCSLGWWYTAPLPQNRRIVSLLTDVDLARAAGLPSADAWTAILKDTLHIAPLLRNAQLLSELVAPASTTQLDQLGSGDWLATGDAAASRDPLSGQGITNALRSGILASYAVADILSGQSSCALTRYQGILNTHFTNFQRLHCAFHDEENRWPSHAFWQRRRTATQSPAETVA